MSKILLIDADNKNPNLALMKISDYHKLKEYPYDMEMGGTGIDMKKKLPDKIEYQYPDYGLGFITRGCPNKCPWCCVPTKEGSIEFHQDPREFRNRLSRKFIFLDNNFLAYK